MEIAVAKSKVTIKKRGKQKARPPTQNQWLYTRSQAAELFGTSLDTIRRLERSGRLTPVRLTSDQGTVFLRREELLALVNPDA